MICYDLPSKAKHSQVISAFAAGCGGRVASVLEPKLLDGDCAFYGVRPPWLHLWEQAKREHRDWFYIDNAYYDCSREKFFRVTKNGLQCDGMNAVWNDEGAKRLKALGIVVQPWRTGGSHVLVCPQTVEFTKICAGYPGDWEADAVAALKNHTDREIRVRRKGNSTPLQHDLIGAHALVTSMSCAAVEALIAGVPVFCTHRCAARWMGKSDLTDIENPYYPERRQEWAELLAANQWSIEELRDGTCWRAFEEQRERGVGHYGR